MARLFALVDCNNFYASCERAFQPRLRGRPVVVLSNNDGCVVARSNEAKALGIQMGEPAHLIEQKLRGVEVFSSNYALYGDMSSRVMEVLGRFAPELEVYSIDEAFLSLEGFDGRDLVDYCRGIRHTVRQWTKIPVSIGIAPTKTLAKVANHLAKRMPVADGVWCITAEYPEELDRLLESVPVEEVWGIGPAYAKLLAAQGIATARGLRDADDSWVRRHLTVVGVKTVWELRGISCLPLELAPPPKKGVCVSRSFGRPVDNLQELSESVATFAARVSAKLREDRLLASALVVFARTNPFKEGEPQYANSVSVPLPVPTSIAPEVIRYALEGLRGIWRQGYRYKKSGVFATGIVPEKSYQPNLFDGIDRVKSRRLMKVLDEVNGRMGAGTLRHASEGFDPGWKVKAARRSQAYTTRWDSLPTVH